MESGISDDISDALKKVGEQLTAVQGTREQYARIAREKIEQIASQLQDELPAQKEKLESSRRQLDHLHEQIAQAREQVQSSFQELLRNQKDQLDTFRQSTLDSLQDQQKQQGQAFEMELTKVIEEGLDAKLQGHVTAVIEGISLDIQSLRNMHEKMRAELKRQSMSQDALRGELKIALDQLRAEVLTVKTHVSDVDSTLKAVRIDLARLQQVSDEFNQELRGIRETIKEHYLAQYNREADITSRLGTVEQGLEEMRKHRIRWLLGGR